ncbi:ATP-binding protein [Campylobacter canadensis]|uniref:ATP-binding protein n=1 Tax=Campylobacter canadensis TaxID=449520 RepID=A0ABS7WS65_9BACT|nr:ATP-binding protein [Campylobacter canadensis]MBZ7987603.1 ATP-binding protein [Campylobacter canadensis]MBZ7994962.1 ATP-binding protein [Campylobacter canadensis]MBZ7996888.1 ATP-binding protein [Campylobacter canadensis]MBZ7998751.1 ATP-binding protein [Campylobacter canadensis]MBZ8000367.1 ATP-binding protein [Campylobacter canadensis]
MKKIENFLDINYKRSFYYKKLVKEFKLSNEAINILRAMLKKTIGGIFAQKFTNIVKDAFLIEDNAKKIEYLPYFLELYESKFIQEASAKSFNYKDNIGLFLFQFIALSRFAHIFFELAKELDGIKIVDSKELEQFVSEPYSDIYNFLNDYFEIINSKQKGEYLSTEIKTHLLKSRLKNSNDFVNPFALLAKDYNLNDNEIIIIAALLKEELTGRKKPLHYEELLNTISTRQIDKIKNYELLREEARLLSNDLITYEGNENSFIIADNALRYFIKNNAINLKNYVENMQFFDYLDVNDVDLIVSNDILELSTSLKKRSKKQVAARLKEWGIVKDDILRANIIFYGPAGTGKTMSAMYIAKVLKKEIITLDCSKVLGKYVGESEKNVRAIFDNYKDIAKYTQNYPILLLNEADQFLSTRSVASNGSELMHNQMQNIFLEQLERFDGIVIATTNFLESLDPAFSRRFEYKIKFQNPNKEEREKIWKLHLPKNAEFESSFAINELLDYELSGAQIKMIVKNTAIKTAQSDGIFRIDDFKDSIKKELQNDFAKEIKMGF